MTSILTVLPLTLCLLGVNNSSKELGFEATVEPAASLRFALIEIPVVPSNGFGNVAPAGEREEEKEAKNTQPEQTPLPRPGVPEPVLGDLNFDSAINQSDLIELIISWGECPQLIDVACSADLNGDQSVNAQDLSMFMRLWNQAQVWAAEAS